MTQKPLVFIESPYAGDLVTNGTYLKECILDSITRGENPYASHGFFTQYLDDTVAVQRLLGMDLGNQWRLLCEFTVFYADLGYSEGRIKGMEFCIQHGHKYIERKIRHDERILHILRSGV